MSNSPLEVPIWKRTLDITGIVCTSILWAPIGLVTAAYIKAVSPGPVFFMQERVGHMGKRFSCLKFRTMHVDADQAVHQKYLNQLIAGNQPTRKLEASSDPRLIPGGAWIRSLGLDELPQLLNILRGEMSLVGPRPCVPYEYELFKPHHCRRCETLPGLTGLWQVSGKNRTTFERMMDLDLAYVEKKSLALDFKILVCTLPAILVQVWDIKLRNRGAKAELAKPVKQQEPTRHDGGLGSTPATVVGKHRWFEQPGLSWKARLSFW